MKPSLRFFLLSALVFYKVMVLYTLTPLITLVSKINLFMFPFIKTWSIWFSFLPSGDLQVRLWVSHDLFPLSFITRIPNFTISIVVSYLSIQITHHHNHIAFQLETVSCSWFKNLSFSSSLASFVSAYASTTVSFLYFE